MTELSTQSAQPAAQVPGRAPTARTAPPKNGRANLHLLVVGAGALMVSLSQSVLIPVLPSLPTTLHTSASTVEWLLTSTLLVAAVAVPVMGRLADMFGKRLLLLVALGTLVVGSVLDAVTNNIPIVIVGRCFQGVSVAAVPLGISLLTVLLPRERVGAGIATISSMLGVGAAVGLPLSGLVAQHLGYHSLFWFIGAGGLLTFVGVLGLVPEAPNRSGGRVDVLGAVLLGLGLMAIMLPLAETASWGWGSGRVIGLLVAGAVVLVVLGWVELRTREPLVDIVALRRRPLVLTNIASMLFGFALFASLLGTASYVQAPSETGYGFGASMLVGGLCVLPSGIGMLLLAPVSARLVAWRGAGQTLALGAIIVAAGWVVRILVTGALWEIIVGTTVVGIGTGVGYAAMPSLINNFTPPAEIAAANGLNTLFRAVGSSLASAIGGSILAAQVMHLGPAALPSLTGYRILFGICACAAVLAALAALAVPNRRAEV
ncbi:MFS transporter [Pseudofrankia inefficax]|uniref:Major facilitator superfamily MFS_1 n=1 Tax=Pseudofrankia inefficax (strain DSM 45817 / CECT 9037 / DDB 130130 / EuI1c) TaxID=298654 RepID=E3JA15_PSEI1|nr:MFS transporter [Pseudofrankia inefficax]ADP78577.1 major facilitator superfamily MFS_1 [Pseudofrankia inefficax]